MYSSRIDYISTVLRSVVECSQSACALWYLSLVESRPARLALKIQIQKSTESNLSCPFLPHPIILLRIVFTKKMLIKCWWRFMLSRLARSSVLKNAICSTWIYDRQTIYKRNNLVEFGLIMTAATLELKNDVCCMWTMILRGGARNKCRLTLSNSESATVVSFYTLFPY